MKFIQFIFLAGILLAEPFDGLTLITTMGGGQGGGGNQPRQTILIDNDQTVINVWEHETGPASIAYLMPDSVLYVPCKVNAGGGGGGGGPNGGRFKKMDWDGNVLWNFVLPTDICIPHHDIAVLPNGNFIAICSETKTQQEALNAGIASINGSMTLDMLIEIEPVGTDQANIVWQWHFWDHLVQDEGSNLQNYGDVSDNPQLLDINCQSSGGGGPGGGQGISDWNHLNCISYNAELQQIVVSARHMNEIYVIDHSTTTVEAASHSGGLYGKGGDFLYRWGNPENYGRGSNADQILNSQHGINWIPAGYPGEGHFILYNNNHSNNNSAVLEFIPPMDGSGNYILNGTSAYGPESYAWMHQSDFYSDTQSGAFRLPNGNTLITATQQETIFEIDSDGQTVWSYNGDLRSARAIKYGYDYFTSTLTGDVNQDGMVNVSDIVITIQMVLGEMTPSTSADLNNDGIINVLDVVLLVNIILGN